MRTRGFVIAKRFRSEAENDNRRELMTTIGQIACDSEHDCAESHYLIMWTIVIYGCSSMYYDIGTMIAIYNDK